MSIESVHCLPICQPRRAASGRGPWRGLLLCLVTAVPAVAWSAPNASALLAAGRAEDALRVLAPREAEQDAATQSSLCRVYYALENWDNAVRHCERAVRMEPDNALYQHWMGRSYGKKAEASSLLRAYPLARKTVAAFQKAHSLEKDNEEIARDLAQYFVRAPEFVGGGLDKAEALADEIANQHPSAAAWIRGEVAGQQGHLGEAEAHFRDSIRLDQASAKPLLDMARFYSTKKLWKKFEESVAEAVRSPYATPEDRYDAAELMLLAERNLEEARRQLRAFLDAGHSKETAPAFRAHYLLGEVLVKEGRPEKAKAEYRAALQLAGSYSPAAKALRRLEKQ